MFGEKRLRVVRWLGQQAEIHDMGRICRQFSTPATSRCLPGTYAEDFDIDEVFPADIIPRGKKIGKLGKIAGACQMREVKKVCELRVRRSF